MYHHAMETFEAVRTILAVRRYQDKPVPADAVHRIVEAGRLTGSSRNLQPWHFVVVRERETLREIGRRAPTGPYVADAALAIVLTAERASPYGVSDASRAAQSMMLTAWSEGIGSNWAGFRNLEPVGELLGVPAEYEVLGVLPFGYPAQRVGRGKKNRKPLSEVASAERWDRPFA